jgi:hypothetical protein
MSSRNRPLHPRQNNSPSTRNHHAARKKSQLNERHPSLLKKTNLTCPHHQTLKNHPYPKNHRRYHRNVARFDTTASSKHHPVTNPLMNFPLSWQPTSRSSKMFSARTPSPLVQHGTKNKRKRFLLSNPKKLPQSRESLGIYLGTYVNPKTEESKVYLNLRLVTTKARQVQLAQFGMELADQFASSKHRMSINRQPRACQAG